MVFKCWCIFLDSLKTNGVKPDITEGDYLKFIKIWWYSLRTNGVKPDLTEGLDRKKIKSWITYELTFIVQVTCKKSVHSSGTLELIFPFIMGFLFENKVLSKGHLITISLKAKNAPDRRGKNKIKKKEGRSFGLRFPKFLWDSDFYILKKITS